MRLSRAGLGVFLGAIVLLCALPFVTDKFYVQLITKILLLAILAMSLDLVLGYTGLVSFGHAAFYGLAGYLLALTTPEYEAANLWTSLPLSIAGSGLLAAAIGALVLRTSGVYFIMASLAFAQMLYFVFHDTELAGGSDGIYIYVRPAAEIAGWNAAVQFGVVNPDFLGWHLSGSVMMMVILGGMGTLVGPAIGACAMMLLEDWFKDLTKHWQLLLGAFIVCVALLLPNGLVGLAARFPREGRRFAHPRLRPWGS